MLIWCVCIDRVWCGVLIGCIDRVWCGVLIGCIDRVWCGVLCVLPCTVQWALRWGWRRLRTAGDPSKMPVRSRVGLGGRLVEVG